MPISYLERPGADPPVLLLHGWGASASTFADLLQRSQSRRRLVAPDLPGFGNSPLGPGGWTTSSYCQLLGEWIGERGWAGLSLLGHSYGGSLCLRLATTDAPTPDRLLLCAAAGFRPRASSPPGPKVRAFKLLRTLARALPGPASQGATEWLSQRFGSADYRAASPELRRTLVSALGEDLSPLARRVAAPTLLVWGEADRELPLDPYGRALEQLIPGAELVVFEACGHFPFLDQPRRFAKVFDALMEAPA